MAVDMLELPKSDLIHYYNLLKIMNSDIYGKWDMGNQEMVHILLLYGKYIIDEKLPQNYPTHDPSWQKLRNILGY